jgi:hypothetical protein
MCFSRPISTIEWGPTYHPSGSSGDPEELSHIERPIADSISRASGISGTFIDNKYKSIPSRELDPLSAGKKITQFLAKKVQIARALEEYRQSIFTRRVEKAPDKASFIVKKINRSDYPSIKEIIKSWIKEIKFLQSDEKTSESDREKLENSGTIISMIRQELIPGEGEHTRAEGLPNPSFFLVAIGQETNNIEAIALVIEPHNPVRNPFQHDYEINLLATSPKNLRLSFQKSRISGSATALIENIAYRALRHTAKKSITLFPSQEAMTFYENLGFTYIEEDQKYSLVGDEILDFLSRFGGISLGDSI